MRGAEKVGLKTRGKDEVGGYASWEIEGGANSFSAEKQEQKGVTPGTRYLQRDETVEKKT